MKGDRGMDEKQIKEMLSGYKVKQNKCKHLEKVVQDLTKQLEKAKAQAEKEAAMLHAQVLDGMPRGNMPGDPTGRIGTALADGKVHSEEVDRLSYKLKEAKEELDLNRRDIEYMEGWIYGLMPREFKVVNCRLVLGMSWADVSKAYLDAFGDEMSERTLSRMLDRAIHQIWLTTEV